jgi:hypothetical protein
VLFTGMPVPRLLVVAWKTFVPASMCDERRERGVDHGCAVCQSIRVVLSVRRPIFVSIDVEGTKASSLVCRVLVHMESTDGPTDDGSIDHDRSSSHNIHSGQSTQRSIHTFTNRT